MKLISLIVLFLIVLSAGCEGCDSEDSGDHQLLSEPVRTATQDQAIRGLMLSAGQSKACDVMAGKIIPLFDQNAPTGAKAGLAPTTGLLWVESCQAKQKNGMLELRIGGRGWSWVSQVQDGPIGTKFSVRGLLKFKATARLTGALDLGYSENKEVATLWFTPKRSPRTTFNPLGDIPIRAEGGWSGIVGTIGEILTGPIDEQARPMASKFGAWMMASRLRHGFTATADLCTGQVDFVIGALGDGVTPERPFAEDGKRWLANQRVKIRESTIDVAGPWDTKGRDLTVEVVSESGPDFDFRLVCQADGERVIKAFLQGRPAALVNVQAQQTISTGSSAELVVRSPSCPVMAIATHRGVSGGTADFRYRAITELPLEPLFECR